MNKKYLKVAQIISIIICVILGTLLHFTYEWSGQNQIVASFSAVNESTWEHLKIAFMPMLLTTIIGYIFLNKKANNYIEAKTIGIFTAIAFITIAFYTYTGILGVSFLIIDVLIFIAAIIIGEYIAYTIMIKEEESTKLSKTIALTVLVFLTVAFIKNTYNPLEIKYFQDPETGKFGIEAKK